MLTRPGITPPRRRPARAFARGAAASLQQCLEQERRSIARDVHDDIGGALTALHIDLAWIGRHCKDAAVLQRVDDAHQVLQQAFDAARRISTDLRPPALEHGVVPAIEGLARGFEQRTGIRTAVAAAGAPFGDLSDAVQLVLYRTVQEALTNVSRHATGCTEVSISLGGDARRVTLAVEDDGRGTVSPRFDAPASFGLQGLRERALSVQGTLEIGSRDDDGSGTRLTLSVPIAPRSAAAGEAVDR